MLKPGAQILTILFGILTTFFLPNTPSQSRFLTEEEHVGALHRLKLDARGAISTSDVDQEAFSWHWVGVGAPGQSDITLKTQGSYSGLQCQYHTSKSQFLCYYHAVSSHRST